MPITEQLRTLARYEVKVVLSALTVAERKVGGAPGLRLVIDRTRTVVDEVAERFLGTQQDAGHADAEPADDTMPDPAVTEAVDEASTDASVQGAPEVVVGTVSAIEDAADTTDTATAATDEGSAVLTEDEIEEVEELAEEYLEQEEVRVTGELADNDELRRVQAELRAKHTIQEQDEQHAG